MNYLHIDNHYITTLQELRECFLREEAKQLNSSLFNELMEYYRSGEIAGFLTDIGEEQLAERIRGVVYEKSDSKMMPQLASIITDFKPDVTFDFRSYLEIVETIVKCNQAIIRLRVLHTAHETIDVRILDPHDSDDSRRSSNCKRIYLSDYQQDDEMSIAFDLLDFHDSIVMDEASEQKDYSDEQVVFLIENVEVGRKYPVELCSELGDRYYDKDEYDKAFKWYMIVTEQNNLSIWCRLGWMYYNGKGVGLDYKEAVKWYRKSAEQGNMYAQYNLGDCYYYGQGVGKSFEEAVKWYRKAAEQGYMYAQDSLGYCYKNGQGVGKSFEEAVKWYRKAAEQGNSNAQNNLGICYKNGQGVGENLEEAVKWYRKSAEQGNKYAQYNLGFCYEKGQGVDYSLAESLEWYSKSARQGYSPARSKLEEKAKGGDMYAQYELGYLYQFGFGVARDYKEAEKWYRKAVDNALRRSEQWNTYNLKNPYISRYWNPYQDFLYKAKRELNMVINHLNSN